MISRDIVVRQLRDLGVPSGCVLLVHTSYSRVGPVEGGPDGLIDALLETIGAEGTLVMPSWTDDDDAIFDPASYDVRGHLGIVADTFWRRDGVLRSAQPFTCAAFGPHAEYIAHAPLILPPHGPDSGIDRVRELDGWALLLGADHDANTTIHVAELAGGAQYRQMNHVTIDDGGRPKRIEYGENDSCCRGFNLVGQWLAQRGLERMGPVGMAATGRLMRCRDVVATVVEELADDPNRFLCHPGLCEECDESRASIP